jgi:hypothetical protein
MVVKFLISSPINIGEKPNNYSDCALSSFLIYYLSFSAIELDLGFWLYTYRDCKYARPSKSGTFPSNLLKLRSLHGYNDEGVTQTKKEHRGMFDNELKMWLLCFLWKGVLMWYKVKFFGGWEVSLGGVHLRIVSLGFKKKKPQKNKTKQNKKIKIKMAIWLPYMEERDGCTATPIWSRCPHEHPF